MKCLVRRFGLVYWGITPQQQPGSYQGGGMMMMKSVIWWRKPEYPEETTDLRQVTDVGERFISASFAGTDSHFGGLYLNLFVKLM